MGPSQPVLHLYRMKLPGNLVRIIIINSRTISLYTFPDYAYRPARQEPVIKPGWGVAGRQIPGGAKTTSQAILLSPSGPWFNYTSSCSCADAGCVTVQRSEAGCDASDCGGVCCQIRAQKAAAGFGPIRPADIQAVRKYFLLPFRSLSE